MKKIFFIIFGIILFLPMTLVQAMSSANYEIQVDGFLGGDDIGAAASYLLRSSFGDIDTDIGSSASFISQDGYRGQIFDSTVRFSTFSQTRSGQVAAIEMPSSTQVVISDSSSFLTGDKIVIIQDEGINQQAALGEIIALEGNTLTVDFFQETPFFVGIDGIGDYVYPMTSSSVDFGTLSSSALSTSLIGWEVMLDTGSDYNVYAYENHDLQASPSVVIPDVEDHQVSIGAGEYGARSSDDSLAGSNFDLSDEPLESYMQLVGSREDGSFLSRDFLTLKVSPSSSQSAGNYSHSITLIYVGAY